MHLLLAIQLWKNHLTYFHHLTTYNQVEDEANYHYEIIAERPESTLGTQVEESPTKGYEEEEQKEEEMK